LDKDKYVHEVYVHIYGDMSSGENRLRMYQIIVKRDRLLGLQVVFIRVIMIMNRGKECIKQKLWLKELRFWSGRKRKLHG